ALDMLQLRLKTKQDVYIGDNIRIVVISIDPSGKSVELGFAAPREIKILRGVLLRDQNNAYSKQQESP
ncbi:MAG TPA: carbon storage regulator, partial [Bacillota bacterium]|nr:carbon storage regulator [Bacillota bacterium]